jgi:NADH-quinone oxidoreductase subunit N
MEFPRIDYALLGPELIVTAMALLLLIWDFIAKDSKRPLWWAALIGLAAAITYTAVHAGHTGSTLAGMFVADPFASFFKLVVLSTTFLVVLISGDSRRISKASLGEFYALILMATLGYMLMASSADMVMIFVAIEMGSIPSYALAAFAREDRTSIEAGLKYFILGTVSSAVMLYGMSFLFGLSGSTSVAATAAALSSGGASFGPAVVGMLLVLVGFAFKMTVVPFHMWVPDTYQGAPTPVTAYFSVVSKTAGLALLIRVLVSLQGAFDALAVDWRGVFVVLSAMTMILGTVVGVVQTNVKRLLAYSSIAHVGYLFIGVAVGTELGYESVIVYLITYVFMTVGAFFVVTAVARQAGGDDLEHFENLQRRAPLLAAAMAIFLLSLAGIPPLAGFIGKFKVFGAAIEEGSSASLALAVIGILTSVVSLFFYCKVLRVMYLIEDRAGMEAVQVSLPMRAAVAASVVFTVLICIYPAPFLRLAAASATMLPL